MAKIVLHTSLGLSLLVVCAYILLFTSKVTSTAQFKRITTSSNVVKVIGNLPVTNKKNNNRAGIMGGNLCWTPPECQEVLKRKGNNGWSKEELDSLTEEERNNCIFAECIPFPGSMWVGEREEIHLELTDSEVNELIKLYLPKNIKLKNITLRFEQEKILVNALSYYLFAPGLVTSEATLDRYGFKLKNLYLGKIPAPESLHKMVENSIDPVITDSLSGHGVSIAIMEMKNSKLAIAGKAPKGLIERKNGVLVINFDVLPQVTPSSAPPDNNYEIQ